MDHFIILSDHSDLVSSAPKTTKSTITKKSEPISGNKKTHPKTPVDEILHLQRTIGNQAVNRLIQNGAISPKLSVRTSDQIKKNTESSKIQKNLSDTFSQNNKMIQRMTAHGTFNKKHIATTKRKALQSTKNRNPVDVNSVLNFNDNETKNRFEERNARYDGTFNLGKVKGWEIQSVNNGNDYKIWTVTGKFSGKANKKNPRNKDEAYHGDGFDWNQGYTVDEIELASEIFPGKKIQAKLMRQKDDTIMRIDPPGEMQKKEEKTFEVKNSISRTIQKKITNKTGMPDNIKTGIENLSGISMDDVKVNYNSSKPSNVNALAFTQGTDIHIGPGQEKHLPHEAWHVVQQKQGRVKSTMQMKDVLMNDDVGLESEADLMGTKALQLKEAESKHTLLNSSGLLVVQRKPNLKHQMEESNWGYWKKKWNSTQYNEAVDTFNKLKKAATFDDPKLMFDGGNLSFETDYTYQQLTELHPEVKRVLTTLVPKSVQKANGNLQWADLIKMAFGTAEYQKMLKDNDDMLSKGGDAIQNDFDFDKFDYNRDDTLENDLSEKENVDSALDLLLSEDKKGFLLGEGHTDKDTKEFLVKNMASLKSKGVTTIYIEHFKTDYQSLLNQFMSSSNNPMPPGLDAFITAIDTKHNLQKGYNIRSVVIAAKKSGMRIVGIDDIQAKGGKGDRAEQRAKKMNFIANKTINKDDRGEGGKFVALTGAAHNKEHVGGTKSVPGLSQTLNVPALIIVDGKLQVDKNIKKQ